MGGGGRKGGHTSWIGRLVWGRSQLPRAVALGGRGMASGDRQGRFHFWDVPAGAVVRQRAVRRRWVYHAAAQYQQKRNTCKKGGVLIHLLAVFCADLAMVYRCRGSFGFDPPGFRGNVCTHDERRTGRPRAGLFSADGRTASPGGAWAGGSEPACRIYEHRRHTLQLGGVICGE